MKKIDAFGDKWKVAGGFGTYKHEYLYKFLRLSPSYQLAYKKTVLKEALVKRNLPKDFSEVLKTFKKLGNVFDLNYLDWWEQIGKRVIEDGVAATRVVFSFNPNHEDEELIASFKDVLRLSRAKNLAKNKIQFEKNKIRLETLNVRYELIKKIGISHFEDIAPSAYKELLSHDEIVKIIGTDDPMAVFAYWEGHGGQLEKPSFAGKKIGNWRLAKLAGLNSAQLRSLKIDSKKTDKNEYARKYLTMLVSKYKKNAFNLAENAARGRFPCSEPVDNDLDFDYQFIGRLLIGDRDELWRALKLSSDSANNLLDPTKSARRLKRKRHVITY